MNDTIRRPADIFSPTTDAVLPTRLSYEVAKAAGRHGYDKPTPHNSIVLLVDHQMGLMLGMRDTLSLGQLVGDVVGHARTAKALGIPTLLTTSNAQWQNEDTLPELKEIFMDQPIYRRTGIINCYEDPTFRKAIENIAESTGRRHIIIAAVTIGTCCLMPTLSMLNDGYSVYPVIDACGGWDAPSIELDLKSRPWSVMRTLGAP
jgi:nicotinamidase-related amidase